MPAHDWTLLPADLFHDFHLSWIVQLSSFLNEGGLPATDYALIEQHRDQGASVAAGPFLDEQLDDDRDFYVQKRRSIVVREADTDRADAMIEILAPGNKSSRHAFDQFLNKALAALDQEIHLLIADLHPPTPRDPHGIHAAIAEALGREVEGLDPAKPLTLVSYRAGADRRGYAQPLAVGDKLADMPLFLSTERYVNVPLEETYMRAFASVPRHLRGVLEGAS